MRNRSALALLALSAVLFAGEEQDPIAEKIDKYRASGMLSPFQPVYESPLFSRDPEGKVAVREKSKGA